MRQSAAADEIITKSKEGLKAIEDEPEKERPNDEIKKATFNRSQSKLIL